MKKLLVLLLAIVMVFALVACKSDAGDETVTTNVTEDEGKENLVQQGAASGSKAVDGNGFRLVGTFEVNDAITTVEIGGKDGIYWIGSDIDSAVFLTETKNDDDSYTVKVYDGDWSQEYTVSSSIKDAIFADIADTVLYCGFSLVKNGFSAEATMTGTGTYGDDSRACTIYTASVNNGTNDLLTATIYVDNEYAITLGMKIEFSDYLKKSLSYLNLDDDELDAYLESKGALFEYSVSVADFNLSETDLEEVTGYAAAYTALYGSN